MLKEHFDSISTKEKLSKCLTLSGRRKEIKLKKVTDKDIKST